MNVLLAEVAGEAIAQADIPKRGKTQKQVSRDRLTGNNGCTRHEG